MTDDKPLFPVETFEVDHVLDLLVNYAEDIALVPTLYHEPARHLMAWLEPEVLRYGELPESLNDLNDFTAGYPGDIASLYFTLLSLTSGAWWDPDDNEARNRARDEISNALYRVVSYVRDGQLAGANAELMDLRPHALRGRKIHEAAKRGHEEVHGTTEEKQTRWAAQQAAVDEVIAKHPRWSITQARHRVAENHKGERGWSYDTLLHHTKDPRKKK